MEFRILGRLEVYDDGKRLELGTRQQRALLAVLLLHPNEPVSVDRLIEALWGEGASRSAAKSVHVLVSRLRKNVDGRLVTQGSAYLARIEPGELDADEFERLLEAGRLERAEGDPDRAGEIFREALELWRGGALADFEYDSFAEREIARLEELRLAAYEDRIDADLARGHASDLIAELESLVAANPLRERLRGQLMLALYRSGRQAEALECYRSGRQQLSDELGLEPGPELRRLEGQILNHDASLDLPKRASPPLRRRRTARVVAALAAGLALAGGVAAGLVSAFDSGGLSTIKADSVGIVDPSSNEIVGEVPIGGEPAALAVGYGSTWVVTLGDPTLTRIDVGSDEITGAVGLDGIASGVAVGFGAVWTLNATTRTVESEGTPAEVSKIDPSTADVAMTIPTDLQYESEFEGPIATGARVVWATIPEGRTPRVVRVDPHQGRATGRTPILSMSALAAGRRSLWGVVAAPQTGVSRIDLSNLEPDARLGISAQAVAVGDGAVWVVAQSMSYRGCKGRPGCGHALPGTLYRLDPATNRVDGTTRVGRGPVALALSPAAVWVANRSDDTLTRISPTSLSKETIPLGNPPTSVAYGSGRIWVGVGSSS